MPERQRPVNGVRLACPAHAVGEDGAVEALKHRVDEAARNGVVRLRLTRMAAEHVIEGEFAGVVEGPSELDGAPLGVLTHALSVAIASVWMYWQLEIFLDGRTHPNHHAYAPATVWLLQA